MRFGYIIKLLKIKNNQNRGEQTPKNGNTILSTNKVLVSLKMVKPSMFRVSIWSFKRRKEYYKNTTKRKYCLCYKLKFALLPYFPYQATILKNCQEKKVLRATKKL